MLGKIICWASSGDSQLDYFQRYLTTSSYVFYKVANSYDLTHMILYNLQKFVRVRSYKFVQISHLIKYVRIAMKSGYFW